jgi:hypothetical protein
VIIDCNFNRSANKSNHPIQNPLILVMQTPPIHDNNNDVPVSSTNYMEQNRSCELYRFLTKQDIPT